jgi:DNA replication and repair protein RecF
VYIKSLSLLNFRSHQKKVIDLARGVNILVGENGVGKTNLLEAIFFSCVGRGFRTPRDKECIKFGENFAKVKTVAQKKFGEITVQITITDKAKQILINSVPISKTGELMGNVACVFFSPDELKLVKESPADRRRFMDIDISQIDKTYFYNLMRYNKTLKQRNALLKTINPKNEAEMRALDIWDGELAQVGAQIAARRVIFCEELNKIVPSIHKKLCEEELVSCKYETNAGDFLKSLSQSRAQDLHLKTTTVGIHRDDIYLELCKKDARVFASQGQQRTLALALKIAELEIFEKALGEKPILLLDDVFSELDDGRRERLLNLVQGGQTIITTTGITDTEAKKAEKIFRIQH